VAKRKVLHDAINVGGAEELGVAQPTAALGTLSLKQMAPAGAAVGDFAGARNFEPFGHRFPRFDSFGSSHIKLFSSGRLCPFLLNFKVDWILQAFPGQLIQLLSKLPPGPAGLNARISGPLPQGRAQGGG